MGGIHIDFGRIGGARGGAARGWADVDVFVNDRRILARLVAMF